MESKLPGAAQSQVLSIVFRPGSSRFDLVSLSAFTSSLVRVSATSGPSGVLESPPLVRDSAHLERGRGGAGESPRASGRVGGRAEVRAGRGVAGRRGSRSAGPLPPRRAHSAQSVRRRAARLSSEPSRAAPPRVALAAPRAAWRVPRPSRSGSCSRWSQRRWPRLREVRRGPGAEVWWGRVWPVMGSGQRGCRLWPRDPTVRAGGTSARMRRRCAVPRGDGRPGWLSGHRPRSGDSNLGFQVPRRWPSLLRPTSQPSLPPYLPRSPDVGSGRGQVAPPRPLCTCASEAGPLGLTGRRRCVFPFLRIMTNECSVYCREDRYKDKL